VTNTKRKRILLVDDDLSILEMYKDRLEKDGFDVVAVQSAADAVENLTECEEFDLVITDIMMAKVDGWDLIDTIRDVLGVNKEVLPVIIITAFEEKGLETKAWRKGVASVYLQGRQPLVKLVNEARIQTGRVRSKFDDTI
jgi:CheY-like chemotaxis protein